MPELLWLPPLGFALGGCGPVIDAGIGSGIGADSGQGIMLPMWRPDPGAFA